MSTTTTPPDAPPPAPAAPATLPAKVSEWGAVAISVVALVAYIFALLIAWWSKSNDTFVALCGVAATNATTVVSFWVGSSKGSADKTAALIHAPAPQQPQAKP